MSVWFDGGSDPAARSMPVGTSKVGILTKICPIGIWGYFGS